MMSETIKSIAYIKKSAVGQPIKKVANQYHRVAKCGHLYQSRPLEKLKPVQTLFLRPPPSRDLKNENKF